MSATARAYQAVRGLILDGTLPPGSRLKEEELAERIGVSRTPIREALRRLVAEGLAAKPDSGAGVLVPDWSYRELEEQFRLRGLMEAHAVTLAASRISDEEIERLQALADAMETCVAHKGDDYLTLNGEFHHTILSAAGSRLLAALMPHLVEVPVINRTFHAYDQAALERSNRHHRELVAALRLRDADWAASVMRSHIANAWHSWSSGMAAP